MKRGVKKQSSTSGSIRVISGQFRGRKLPVLNAQGLRPTTDRTKETLFNWLMPYVADSNCLDMFAGSGSLGIEALSRYAKSCVFFELDKPAANSILANLSTLKVSHPEASVLQGDAFTLCQQLSQQFDLVFIDPPFHHDLVPKSIDALDKNPLLRDQSIVYVECETNNNGYNTPDNWRCIKERNTQSVSSRLFIVEH